MSSKLPLYLRPYTIRGLVQHVVQLAQVVLGFRNRDHVEPPQDFGDQPVVARPTPVGPEVGVVGARSSLTPRLTPPCNPSSLSCAT